MKKLGIIGLAAVIVVTFAFSPVFAVAKDDSQVILGKYPPFSWVVGAVYAPVTFAMKTVNCKGVWGCFNVPETAAGSVLTGGEIILASTFSFGVYNPPKMGEYGYVSGNKFWGPIVNNAVGWGGVSLLTWSLSGVHGGSQYLGFLNWTEQAAAASTGVAAGAFIGFVEK
jgi:hypothetical protein